MEQQTITPNEAVHTCHFCHRQGTQSFCNYCGEAFEVKRITLGGLLHDVFHYFTHLEHGFLYTLKQLIVAPGTMQREYVAGHRTHHQKPFSMFFLCGTATALLRYWVYNYLLASPSIDDRNEIDFYHHRMVLLQVLLLPFFTLLNWLVFRRSKYNYAETGVLVLYTSAAFFLIASIVSLLKFIWIGLDTAYIELPLMLLYNTVTMVRFYRQLSPWATAIKSIILLTLYFVGIQYLEDWVIHTFSHS